MKRKSITSCVLVLISSSMILTTTADSRNEKQNNDNNIDDYYEQRASRLQTNPRRKKKHIINSQKRKLNWGSVTWMDGDNYSNTNDNNDSIRATKSSKRKGRTKGKARKHINDDKWGHGGDSNNTTSSSVLPQPTAQSSSPTMSPQQPTMSPTKPLPILTIAGDNNDPEHVFPLAECHGDCDEDTDCAEGLHCYMREDIEEVPGCQGSGESGKDYCFKPTSIDLIIKGDNNDPEHAFPLMSCQGDCDEDADCGEGLYCFKRDDLEEVPGCRGKGVKDYDYCFMPGPIDLIIKGDDNDPEHAFPLAECQGDCDEDEDCDGELKCFKRDEYEEVPGCVGQGSKGSDYCYSPDAMEEMPSNTNTTSEDDTPSTYTPTSFPSASSVDNAASDEMSSGGRFPTILWPPPPASTPTTSSPSNSPVTADNLLFGITSPATEIITSSPSLSSTSEDTNTTLDTSSSSVGTLLMPPPLTDIEMDLFGLTSLNPIDRNVFETQTSNYINSFYNDVTNSSDIRANVTVVTSSIDVTDQIIPMFIGTSAYPDADCTEIIPLTVKFALKFTLYTTNEDTDYDEVITYPFSTAEFKKRYIDEYLKANDEMGYQDLQCVSSIRIPTSYENAASNSTTEEEEVEGEEDELSQDMPTLPPIGDDGNTTDDGSTIELEAPTYVPTSGMPTYSPSASEESVDLRMNHPDIYERKCDNPEVLLPEKDIDDYEVSFEYGVESTSNTIHFIDELGRMILDFLAISVIRCSEAGPVRSQGGSGVVSIILANTEVWSCDPYESGCAVLNTKLLITSSGLSTSDVHRDILSVLKEAFKESVFVEFIPELTTTSYLGPEPEVFSFVESEETINEETNAAGIIFRVSCALLILFGVSVVVLVASMAKCPGKLPDKVLRLLNKSKNSNALITTKEDTKKEDEEVSDIDADTVEDDSSQLLQGSVVAL